MFIELHLAGDNTTTIIKKEDIYSVIQTGKNSFSVMVFSPSSTRGIIELKVSNGLLKFANEEFTNLTPQLIQISV